MTEQDPKKARQAALNKIYGEASAMLRSKYQDEFNEFMAEAAKKAGIDWKPKKSKEDRAREQLAALYAEFPHLAPGAEQKAQEEGEPVPQDALTGAVPAFRTGSEE